MASQPRTSTSRSNRDDVLQFLDSLDNYSPQSTTGGAPPKSSLPRSTSNSTLPSSSLPSTTATPPPKSAKEAQSVLDFLDEITATTPSGGGAAPPSRTSIDQSRRTTPSTIGRTTSRSNISQVAAGGVGQSPVAGAARKSTESVRSTRSLVNQPSAASTTSSHSNERNSPVPTSRTTAASQLNTPTRPASSLPEPSLPSPSPASAPAPTAPPPQQSGGWGWSSVWSTASTAINQASALAQQARTAAEEQVKHAAQQAQAGGGFPGEGLMKAAWGTEEEGGVAKKWTEGVQGLVKNANLEHLGKELKSSTLKSLTDLLNAVAPPIAEHEVISVQLSHDMLGYDGVETLVYRGLSKIMEQIEGGTLMVNRAGEVAVEEQIKEKSAEEANDGVSEEERNLNLVQGLEQGWKTAQTKLDDLIKTSYKPPASPLPAASRPITVPVTTCPVYLRIQPALSTLPSSSSPSKHLFFLLLLIDPTHSLTHQTLSQSLPATWLDIPFEENEWVEDQMVEVIRRSTEVIGQEYIVGRMRAQKDAIEKAREEARKVVESGAGEGEKEGSEKEKEEEVARASQEARVGIV